ncbi:hypothetical protein RHGRI_004477 [Rhododendron griersonianum]|uniref:Uncharacterized protein n=1 Tax=Rhododendron griersonianum TaxID=479676 RepID=A0AAV6LB61_9ERIC|nr:hypothetical protein RHGRI_004477 [Rhododendron griersonianum]
MPQGPPVGTGLGDPIQSCGVLREGSEASLRCHAWLRALRSRQHRGNSLAGPTRPRRAKNKHPNLQNLLLTTNQNRESRSRPTVPDLIPANPDTATTYHHCRCRENPEHNQHCRQTTEILYSGQTTKTLTKIIHPTPTESRALDRYRPN